MSYFALCQMLSGIDVFGGDEVFLVSCPLHHSPISLFRCQPALKLVNVLCPVHDSLGAAPCHLLNHAILHLGTTSVPIVLSNRIVDFCDFRCRIIIAFHSFIYHKVLLINSTFLIIFLDVSIADSRD